MVSSKKFISELFSLARYEVENSIVYAIIDAGIYREFIDILDIENPKHRILFKDMFVREYENVAPYLVKLSMDDPLTKQIIDEGYTKPWLSFLVSNLDIDSLAEVLKAYINPYSQVHKQEIIFRFYDPRNIARFIKMLTEEEFQLFKSDIGGFLVCIDINEPTLIHIYNDKNPNMILLKEVAS